MTNLIDPPPEPSRPLPIGGVRCARCRTRLAEYFLPVYDVSDAVAAVTDAATEMTSQALLDVDPLKLGREAPLVGMLAALRMLPQVVGHLLHG